MKIGVLMGGVSSEREVSLLSGEEITKYMDKEKYEVFPIVIDSKEEVLEKVRGLDFVFLALHGAFGEDGSIQALLESISMPYSGCGVLTSALCMSKKQSKRILKAEGITTPPGFIAYANKELPIELIETLGYPVVVKPNNGGSSVGTFIASNRKILMKSIEKAFEYDEQLLIEKYLKGEEYTISVLNGQVLPILQIRAKGEFFDYSSKYEDGGAEEVAAKLPKALEEEMNKIAKACWEIFDCRAYVRIDIIVHEGIPYVLELNTLPGMTKNSLFPRSASFAGMEYRALLDNIIKASQRNIYKDREHFC